MSSSDTPIISDEKQVDQQNDHNSRILGKCLKESISNATYLPENREISFSRAFLKAKPCRQISKTAQHTASEQIGIRVSISDSSTPLSFENSRDESSPRLKEWWNGKMCGDLDPAVKQYQELTFKVTKITKKWKQHERIRILLSDEGIYNISSPEKGKSLIGKWSDVLLCYKIDELTVAIKDRNGERRYKTESWDRAQILFNAVWIRMNPHQDHSRKHLKKSMVDGVDQKEKDKAVLEFKNEECLEKNFEAIRVYVEQILLWSNSKVFKLKQNICNFALPNMKKLKELRIYLNQFKYKIFEEYRMELWAKIDLTDPNVRKRTLWIIERAVESTCIPHHIEGIDKVLRARYKIHKNLIPKLDLLCKKPQELFGIEKRLRSKDGWLSAVRELEKFPKKMLPSGKMECLLSTTKYIHQEAKDNNRGAITGDDLLPIVIYVMVKASEKSQKLIFTEADRKFIEILISPEALQGECGYYLCVFSAGSEFIRNYDSQRKEEKLNNIRKLRNYGVF